MQLFISVIVPVYQVEFYLARCIESLLKQSYTEYEIVLIDDGSTDNCAYLCDSCVVNDSRIKVIHKLNGGLSDARNAGVSFANGELLSFIDSDDMVSDDFFEVMLLAMKNENSDIVECNVAKFYEDNHFDFFQDDLSVKSYSTVEGLAGLIGDSSFHQHVWNKLYKTELVKSIRFPFGKLNEDEFWTYQVFSKAKKVTRIKKTMYYYFQRNDSIMGESFNLKRLDAIEGKCNRQHYIEKNYPELASQARINLFSSCIFSAQASLKFLKKEDKKKAKNIINHYVKSCKPSKAELNTIKGKNRFWFKFAYKSFWLCCKVRAMTGIGL